MMQKLMERVLLNTIIQLISQADILASSGEKTVYIESIAGGTAEVFAYTLVK